MRASRLAGSLSSVSLEVVKGVPPTLKCTKDDASAMVCQELLLQEVLPVCLWRQCWALLRCRLECLSLESVLAEKHSASKRRRKLQRYTFL